MLQVRANEIDGGRHPIVDRAKGKVDLQQQQTQ
jgi:hypothetical protein